MLLIGLASIASAPAQSATSFNTKEITPKAPPPGKPKTTDSASKEANPAAPVNNTPSRLIGDTDIAAYVKSLSSVFSMRTRSTDPFGQPQDPDAKPVIKTTVAKTSRRVAQTQATPLSEIIQLIQVTTIMPKEKRFLVGTRSIKQGDNIPINFRGKTINLEISSVSSREIQFRNLATNESASIKLNLLPVGMTPGTNGITAPGMAPDRPDSPLNLDSAPNPADSTLNP